MNKLNESPSQNDDSKKSSIEEPSTEIPTSNIPQNSLNSSGQNHNSIFKKPVPNEFNSSLIISKSDRNCRSLPPSQPQGPATHPPPASRIPASLTASEKVRLGKQPGILESARNPKQVDFFQKDNEPERATESRAEPGRRPEVVGGDAQPPVAE